MTDGEIKCPKPTEPEKAIDIMLAEFEALRAEKVSYLIGQARCRHGNVRSRKYGRSRSRS